MRRDDVRLRGGLTSPEAPRLVHAECLRIARRLRADGIARVGILPASRAEVDAPSFAVDLGAALAELTGGAVAVIDANLHWPTVPRPPSTPGGDDDPPSSVPADRARAFSARAVRDGVTLVTPRLRSTATAGIELPRALLDQWSERCPHLVVDLAGFEALGNLGEAVGLVDGVLILAATGRTRDLDLLRIHAELPEACRVGVVLLG